MGPHDGLVDAPGTGLEDAPEAVERRSCSRCRSSRGRSGGRRRSSAASPAPPRRSTRSGSRCGGRTRVRRPRIRGLRGWALPAGPELAGHDRRLAGPGLRAGVRQRRRGGASARLRRRPRRRAPAPALTSTTYSRAPTRAWGLRSCTSAFPRPTGARRARPGERRRRASLVGRRAAAGTHGLHPPSGVWKRSCGRARGLPPGQRQQVGRMLQGDGGEAGSEPPQRLLGQARGGRGGVARGRWSRERRSCAARAASTRGARPSAASEPPAAPSRLLRVSPRWPIAGYRHRGR